MNGMEHEMLMPGMLTEDQMQQLDQARGAEFDRLFLTFMIQHHKGAVSMVKDLFGSYGAAQDETVFKFATDVSVDQTTEIARMEKMLAALSALQPLVTLQGIRHGSRRRSVPPSLMLGLAAVGGAAPTPTSSARQHVRRRRRAPIRASASRPA